MPLETEETPSISIRPVPELIRTLAWETIPESVLVVLEVLPFMRMSPPSLNMEITVPVPVFGPRFIPPDPPTAR